MKDENVKITNEQLKEISKNIQLEDVIKEIKNNQKDYLKYAKDNSKSKLLYTFFEFTPVGVIVDLVGCNDEK